jgi:death-on-curing protein
MTRYVTVDELIYINEQLPAAEHIHKILKGKQKVRDMGLLEAAAGRPQRSVFGADAYPTLPEKAAALLHAIARNHPFADGNKRTGTVGLLFMLHLNGAAVAWQPDEALERIVQTAEGVWSAEQLAAWLPILDGAHPPQPDPDAERDAATLHALLSAHAGLLAALAER